MNGFILLLFLQIWSYQILLPSLATPNFSASHSKHPIRTHNRQDFNKQNEEVAYENTDFTERNEANVHNDDFGIDGLGDLIKRLGYFDEVDDGKDLDDYDPITDSLVSHISDDNPVKGTKKKVNNFGEELSEDDSFKSTKKSKDSDSSFFLNTLNGSLFTIGSNNNYNLHKYNYDVYTSSCPEKCACEKTKVDCVGKNLTSVPKGIDPLTTWLDLSMNSLQKLPEDTFAHMTHLKELRCVGNNLTELPHRLFRHNKLLQLLNFQGNFFTRVPPRAFQNLSYLLELHLDANEISSIPRNAFVGLTSLKQLWLDANKLRHIPVAALQELTGLQALTLIKNDITHLPDYVLQNNTRLIQLRLANNAITDIAEHAFYGLTKLKFLQLQHNKITRMPSALSHLVSLEELNLEGNLLTEIPDKSFQMKDKLTTLLLENNPIKFVAERVFTHLPSLKAIKLSEVHDMNRFPDLTGTTNLTFLRLDRANIRSIPGNLCVHLKNLQHFDLHSNKIGSIPQMSQCKDLSILNMDNNELTSIDGKLFYDMDNLKDLTLATNYIHTIGEDTFVGLSALEYLNLAMNQITVIHSNAFLPLKSIKDLNLADNRISHLPTAGLTSLEKLKVFNNPNLREFPSKERFPNVNNFVLSYAYHCCDFMLSKPEEPATGAKETVIFIDTKNGLSDGAWNKHYNFSSELINYLNNFTNEKDLWEAFSDNDFDISDNHDPTIQNAMEDNQNYLSGHNYVIAKAAISCKPQPGPFMPCDDLFGWWSLRCGVWFVFMLALLGNGVVFFVSVTSKSKMDVPRFLICNLALADFFMGIYLGILAIMDASTLGHFKKYAIQWQMSAGCLVAGTLGVLSSELSVFTLTVITLERFYAITHAMQLNKRLSLKHAGIIMMCGWFWSFGLAVLPLFGISDYRKFAVCLPFEIGAIISKSYVCFIMVFNGVAFLIILSCYMIMYISIRHSQAWNSNDTRVAKRMALLVFTDFLCWAPIAFLSLSAAFGSNLIELNEAKVLTIFILPLNSCANPFLYAFFTKQFKKDCVLLCRRLEDSFLAKHFSQATQRNVSMSWKYQRRPSALHSLMGESKSNNSQNNSSGSNSYGLLNYNSEISTGTNRGAGKEVLKSDTYVTQATIYSISSSGGGNSGTTYYKHTHKYKPCPSNGNEEDDHIVKNTYADISDDDDDDDDDDIQVILHQDFYSKRGTVKPECMVESCVDDDSEHRFILSSQKSCDGFSKVDINIKANSSLQYPSIVIHEDGSPTKDETYIWKKRSLHSLDLELQDMSKQEVEIFDEKDQIGYSVCQEKWKVNEISNNEKQINTGKQINQNYSGDTTNNVNGEISSNLPTTFSVKCANSICLENNKQEKSVIVSDKHKISECKSRNVLIAKVGEGDSFRSKQGNWRDNLQCCTTTFSPVEQRNHIPGFLSEAKLTEDETCTKHKPVTNLECHLYIPQEVINDQAKIRKNGEVSDSNEVLSVAEGQLDNSPAAVVIFLKTDQTEKANPEYQQKVLNVPVSLSLECYTKQCLTPPSSANFCSNTNTLQQMGHESKQLNIYHQIHNDSTIKDQSVLVDFCVTCDKHVINKVAPNLPTPASINSVLTPELPHNKNNHLHYFQQSITDCEILGKSNSLVELSHTHSDEGTTPLLSTSKRRSLTTNQESYMLLHGENHVPNVCIPINNFVTHSDTCENDIHQK